MRRKRFSEREVIETLAWQGIVVPCYRCKGPICFKDKLGDLTVMNWPRGFPEREHILEIALYGDDAPHNCAYSHGVCHAVVSNGTKSTTAGSSKQRIAKVKRIQAGGKKRKGPPMKSRGFNKSLTRKFNGEVVPR